MPVKVCCASWRAIASPHNFAQFVALRATQFFGEHLWKKKRAQWGRQITRMLVVPDENGRLGIGTPLRSCHPWRRARADGLRLRGFPLLDLDRVGCSDNLMAPGQGDCSASIAADLGQRASPKGVEATCEFMTKAPTLRSAQAKYARSITHDIVCGRPPNPRCYGVCRARI
jgi:hypothetical protein